MKLFDIFSAGVFRNNPTFKLVLGLCPTLAVTTSLENALGMGLAATFVLTCSNLLVSLLRKCIPDAVHIPCYIVIVATFVTVTDLAMKAYLPALSESLGIFIPLIVVNCIILGRAEAFASKNGPVLSVADGLGTGAGFTLALSFVAAVREIVGNGSLTFWGGEGVEEIFGEIEDEHDNSNYVAKRLDSGDYVLSARLEIDKVNELFDLDLPESDDYMTVSGLILHEYQSFPKLNEEVKIGKFRFKIIKNTMTKIELVKLKVEEDD